MNATEIDGHHPLEPILPPEVSTDANEDMSKRKKPILTIQVFYHGQDGNDYHEIVSEPLPTGDYPIEKAVAHLGARAAESISKRLVKQVQPGRD